MLRFREHPLTFPRILLHYPGQTHDPTGCRNPRSTRATGTWALGVSHLCPARRGPRRPREAGARPPALSPALDVFARRRQRERQKKDNGHQMRKQWMTGFLIFLLSNLSLLFLWWIKVLSLFQSIIRIMVASNFWGSCIQRLNVINYKG